MRKNDDKIKLMLSDVGDFLAKFTEHSDHVYWISSPDFKKIQYISPSYERIWGRSREALYSNPEIWITFLHPDDAINHHPIHEMATRVAQLGEKARYSENYRIIRPDGEVRWIMDNGFPFYNEEGVCIGVSGIAIDVTKERLAVLDLKIAKEKAEAANSAKTEFIANMSHDIRTPLTGIVGMSQILEDELQQPHQKQYAHWVHQSGDQLLGLLNGILDVISAENMNEQDIHNQTFIVHQFIKDIVALEQPSIELKGITFNSIIDSNVPRYIKTDRTKLRSIILNLLGNAIKFTKIGNITIEVKSSEIIDQKVVLHFCVTDTGIGIPITLQNKVFDRFFRANPSYKGIYEGHGIGLHVAQSYAALLNTELKLTSKEGVGTIIHFDLVCQIGKSRDVVPSKEEPTSVERSMIKTYNDQMVGALHSKKIVTTQNISPSVLLVEDNLVALKILENMVKQVNVHYISAIDGESALELAKTQSFDLIISDIGLPGITGNEFTHQFRTWEVSQHKKPTPIVGLTAHAQGEIRDECLQAGMNDVFSKPMLLPVLQTIISKYVSSISEIRLQDTQNKEGPGANKLGRDLPDSEEKLFDLVAFPLLDIERALDSMGNNKVLLIDILQSMITQEIPVEKRAIQDAYARHDWDTIEKLAHKMKGGAVYAGVVKMQYACQYLERYRKAGHTKLLEKLYQQMLNILDETQEAITKWLQIDKH
ncbi:MAG: ATP-binding protein [Candidatus Chromulinivorax sp.]|nr:ATP-binding protein [Candidatus Chromulinivorax sp.]